MGLQPNFKGNNRYYLLNNFNEYEELGGVDFLEEEYDRNEGILFNLLRNSMGIGITEDKFYDIFGCAYVSSGGYALITLDTNAFVFIDDEYYMSHLAFSEDETFIICESELGNPERYFIIY